MHDLEKTLLVHLSKASVYLEPLPVDADKAKAEIEAAIELLTAEKPKRKRRSPTQAG